MIMCVFEESDDGIYEYGLESEGEVFLFDDYFIEEELDRQLFSISQASVESIDIIDNKIHCSDVTFDINELDDLVGCSPDTRIVSCVFKNN